MTSYDLEHTGKAGGLPDLRLDLPDPGAARTIGDCTMRGLWTKVSFGSF